MKTLSFPSHESYNQQLDVTTGGSDAEDDRMTYHLNKHIHMIFIVYLMETPQLQNHVFVFFYF